MRDLNNSALSDALSELRQQALQHLVTSGETSAEQIEDFSSGQVYDTMLALQQQALHQARIEVKALRLAVAVTSQAHPATDPASDKFHRLFEYSSDAVFLMIDNFLVDCNAAALALLRATDKSQLLGRHTAELAPTHQPDGHLSRKRADEYCRLAFAHGSYRYEWMGKRCTGELFWEEIQLTPITVDGQHLMHALWRDITPLKLAEERRHQSEEDLHRALRAASVGTMVYTIATREASLDEQARAVMGLPASPDPLPYAEFLRSIHPDDVATTEEGLALTKQAGKDLLLDFRVVWPDSTIHYVRFRGEVATDVQGQPAQLLGVMRDITIRREAQRELRHKNRLLEHIVQNLPVVLGRITPGGIYQELVGLGLRRVEIEDNQMVGASVFDVFPSLAESTRRLLAGKSINYVGFADHKGEQVYFQNYGFFDEQKQEAIVFAIDVTESEQMKATLRAEKNFTKHLLDHSLDAVVALDMDLRVTAWNQVAARYSALPEILALGRELFELLPNLGTCEMRQLLEQVRQGSPATLRNQLFQPRPGTYDTYLMPLNRSEGGEMTGVLVIVRDVTERNRMLDDAARVQRQQQKAVFQAVFTAQEAERKRIAEALHNGVGQLLYVTKLTLESRSRPDYPADPVALRVLEEAILATRTVSHQLTPGILEDFGLQVALGELGKHIPPEKLQVHLHLTGLHQSRPLLLDLAVYRIVQELLSNVIKHAQAQQVHVQVEHDDGQVVLSVQDDGRGLPTSLEVAAPGMGLAGIRNRTELLGGRFAIDSRLGRGTTVRVALPVQPE